jgi:hypothetical protein
VENWLVRFIQQEMRISHAILLIEHFGSMYKDFFFLLDCIQILINIVMLGYRPNIDLELCKTFLHEFKNPKQKMIRQEPLSKCVVIKTLFRSKIT